MTGGPWHCGFPMEPRGGYQGGGDNEWVGFRCDQCGHQQTAWGHIHINLDKSEVFQPRPGKILTVLMCVVPNGVLTRGISEDQDIFVNLLYTSADAAVQQIGKYYSVRGFRCVFNLPKEDQP